MEANKAATAFLAGGGELGKLTRAKDWSQTSIGTPDQWPQSLRTILRVILHARFPMFLWWGPDLIQFYNDAYRPSLGNNGKHPTALGQCGEQCWPEIWPTIKPLIDQVLAGETTGGDDQLIPIYRNGRIENVYWTFSYSPVWSEANQVVGVLVVCQETTRNIALAQEAQERFQFAIEAAQFGIWELNPTTNTVQWDDRCGELFGLANGQDIPYREAIQYIHPDDVTLVDEAVLRGMNARSGGHYDLTYRTIGATDQRLRWVRFTGRSYFNPQGELYRFGGVAHDVTREVQARQQVEATAAYLQHIFRSAAVGIAIFHGPAFIIEVANPNVCTIWGRTEEQVMGKPLFEALPEAAGQGFEELLADVMRTGTPFVGHELPATINRNGQLATVYFDFVYDALPEADGQINRILVTASDATARREARQQTERLLIQERELNELKSNFVTLASHEFRTPIGTILSSASLIGRYNGLYDTDRRERHVQRIKSAVHTLTDLLNDFLSLSQMKQTTLHSNPYPLTISTFCEEVLDDMRPTLKPGQRIVYTHQAGEAAISLDGQLLKNILVNLLVNASKYSAEGKKIDLITAIEDGQLLLTVSDEGVGIPDADKDKLFVNFFRARNATHIQGTGLGLYIVKRYVDILGGHITFTSQLNVGTVFTARLPLSPLPT